MLKGCFLSVKHLMQARLVHRQIAILALVLERQLTRMNHEAMTLALTFHVSSSISVGATAWQTSDMASLAELSKFFHKEKTFKPKKKFVPGTLKHSLHKQAQASLNSGLNLREAVRLPHGDNYHDWLAVHVVDFFNRINLIYGTVTDFCTETSCPTMSGGRSSNFLSFDESIFPSCLNWSFPRISTVTYFFPFQVRDSNTFGATKISTKSPRLCRLEST